MSDDYFICEGCGGPIFEGDELLILNFNEDVPEILLHKNTECLLKLDEVSSGTLGPVISNDTSSLRFNGLKRIK